MNVRTLSIPRPSPQQGLPESQRLHAPMLLAAPAVALLIGLSAEWLDFRALRAPLLLLAGLGILATAYAIDGMRGGRAAFLRTAGIGFATWAAAQSLYVLLHVARGEAFDAGRFGPQWAQALGLIAAHGLFLGVPTGVVAALILRAPALRRRLSRGA